MSNPWIQHVKAHATANNITYKRALTEAKPTYRARTPDTGSKSGYVRKLIATGEVNVSKIKKPSEWLKKIKQSDRKSIHYKKLRPHP